MCRGVYQYSSVTITKVLNFNKDQIKLQIIIFCVKHNRDCEGTIRLELKTGKVGDVGNVNYVFEHYFNQCY